MSKKKKERPVVVVQGAPEWMVTFGDLMSLLLTFFILLYSVSEIKEQKIFEVFQSFQVHFNIQTPNMGYHVEPLSDIVELLSNMALELPDQKEGTLGKVKVEVENPIGEHAEVVWIRDSLRINVEGRVLFDEGSAELKEEGRATLAKVRERLIGLPNRLRVVGHASPLPLPPHSSYQDHNDLGYHRARAVARFLTGADSAEKGILEERIEIASRGAHDRLDGVNLFDREDRNRLSRVEIIMTPENALVAARELQHAARPRVARTEDLTQ